MNEKEIVGYPNYTIRTDGLVFSKIVKRILRGQINLFGYPTVVLYNSKPKRIFVHRLVADAFLEKPAGKTQVNHKNGIKTDNRVENLEWCTQSENLRHAVQNGLHNPTTGEKHGLSKLTENSVRKIYEMVSSGANQYDIAEQFKISQTTVSDIKRKKRWRHLWV